jgi:hypothetical protein
LAWIYWPAVSVLSRDSRRIPISRILSCSNS